MRVITILLVLVIVVFLFPFNAFANPLVEPEFPTTTVVISSIICGASVFSYFLIDHLIKVSRFNRIEFVSEDVSIYINSDSVKVEGRYHFRNTDKSDRQIDIEYPFFIGEGVRSPTNISVYIDDNLSYHFVNAKDKIKFEVQLPAGGEREVLVTFNQPSIENYYTYILTTTKKWGRPLESAVFRIYSNGDFMDIVSSYPLSPQIDVDGTQYYVLTEGNFMPEKDLMIMWSSKDK
ncbi:MAG: hypothetical protein ACUVWP_02790 [bacterium]